MGLVLGGFVAICCSAGKSSPSGVHVQQTPDSGVPDASNDVNLVPYDAGKPVDINTGDGSMPLTTDDRPTPTCTTNCTDFPAAPVMDDMAPTAPPANAATLFGAADNMGTTGPCVLEPPRRPG